jgi:hypothetical protein
MKARTSSRTISGALLELLLLVGLIWRKDILTTQRVRGIRDSSVRFSLAAFFVGCGKGAW